MRVVSNEITANTQLLDRGMTPLTDSHAQRTFLRIRARGIETHNRGLPMDSEGQMALSLSLMAPNRVFLIGTKVAISILISATHLYLVQVLRFGTSVPSHAMIGVDGLLKQRSLRGLPPGFICKSRV